MSLPKYASLQRNPKVSLVDHRFVHDELVVPISVQRDCRGMRYQTYGWLGLEWGPKWVCYRGGTVPLLTEGGADRADPLRLGTQLLLVIPGTGRARPLLSPRLCLPEARVARVSPLWHPRPRGGLLTVLHEMPTLPAMPAKPVIPHACSARVALVAAVGTGILVGNARDTWCRTLR